MARARVVNLDAKISLQQMLLLLLQLQLQLPWICQKLSLMRLRKIDIASARHWMIDSTLHP